MGSLEKGSNIGLLTERPGGKKLPSSGTLVSFPQTTDKKESSPSERVNSENAIYKSLIESSVSIILSEQHPITGLYPAATKDHYVDEHHYGHVWVRDASAVGAALIGLTSGDTPIDPEIKRKACESGVRFIKGMLELSSSEPWKSAFNQKSEPAVDESGHKNRKLVKEAPPIHLKADGSQCAWDAQNQPDAWGEFLIILGSSLKQGVFAADAKQEVTINSITRYLLDIKVPELEQFAMWEWAKGDASLSSVAIVAKGLDMIAPHVSPELRKRIGEESESSRKFIETLYPTDYTVCYGHRSRTDLATFVAHGFNALEEFSFDKLLEEADMELGNGQNPGKKRFIGDHYYRADEEAIWPLGALLEAKIFLERSKTLFKNGDHGNGGKLRLKGITSLKKIIDLKDKHGYVPELLEQRGGNLVPNNNNLLWNHGVLIEACKGAIESGSSSPTNLN